jgi:uncharacterized repeat protein (TIGR04076 family)
MSPPADSPPEPGQTMTHDVRITVLDVLESGEPPCGYRAGDSWLVTDFHAPEGMCMWALNAIAPFLATLRCGGVFPWESDRDRAVVCCPDPGNPVVLELRRVG